MAATSARKNGNGPANTSARSPLEVTAKIDRPSGKPTLEATAEFAPPGKSAPAPAKLDATAKLDGPPPSTDSSRGSAKTEPQPAVANEPKRKKKRKVSDSQDADQAARNRMSAAGTIRVDTMPEDVVRDLVQPLRERPLSGPVASVDATIADDADDWETPAAKRSGMWLGVAAVAVVGVLAFWMSRSEPSPAASKVAVAEKADVTEIVPPLPDTPPPAPVVDVPAAAPNQFAEANLDPTQDELAAEDPAAEDPAAEDPAAEDPAPFPGQSDTEESNHAPADERPSSKRKSKSKSKGKKPAASESADAGSSSSKDEEKADSGPLRMPSKVTAAVKECGRKHGGLPGDRVSTKLEIDGSGTVTSASTSGRRVSGDLSSCIASAIKRGSFPGKAGKHTHYFTL